MVLLGIFYCTDTSQNSTPIHYFQKSVGCMHAFETSLQVLELRSSSSRNANVIQVPPRGVELYVTGLSSCCAKIMRIQTWSGEYAAALACVAERSTSSSSIRKDIELLHLRPIVNQSKSKIWRSGGVDAEYYYSKRSLVNYIIRSTIDATQKQARRSEKP